MALTACVGVSRSAFRSRVLARSDATKRPLACGGLHVDPAAISPPEAAGPVPPEIVPHRPSSGAPISPNHA
jgi:hypothetical protein